MVDQKHDCNRYPPFGLLTRFGSKSQVYDFLRTYPGLNVPPYVEPPRVLPPTPKYLTKEQLDSIHNVWGK
jgi:hypothetical protein